MIDLMSENVLGLIEAAKRLPKGRRGRPVTLSCILRWILEGTLGPDGTKVRLEAIRLGGRWVTSEQALQRFAEQLTPVVGVTSLPAPRSPKRTKRAERASEAVDAVLSGR
jgi:hypothetical protein